MSDGPFKEEAQLLQIVIVRPVRYTAHLSSILQKFERMHPVKVNDLTAVQVTLHPFLQKFVLALSNNDILHGLEVFGNGSTVTIHTALQLHNSTDRLSFVVDHIKRFRHLSHFQSVYHAGDLTGQVLHAEFRCTGLCLPVGKGHQTVVVACIFVIRDISGCLLKRELRRTDIISNRVKTQFGFLNSLRIHFRFHQNMTAVQLVATLVDQLNDVETEFCLNNLRDFLRISEVESHSGKCRIEHATSHIA